MNNSVLWALSKRQKDRSLKKLGKNRPLLWRRVEPSMPAAEARQCGRVRFTNGRLKGRLREGRWMC